MTKAPADCTSKEDVRAELDRIDQALLALFAERHRYVTRMAEIKTDPHEAYDLARINAILSKQRKRAEELGLDEDQAELIWKTLIDWNVNYEKGIIVARRHAK
ncbi:MAG: chorismate mutase [Devosia nanyangense]|uniref:chorismate mutase n=1 Tax=Devosia nanyangense TaxID=1228055 RepID=A0A933NVE7_9HYPH|nr:chorismate mutase [Devosia nanyangense]